MSKRGDPVKRTPNCPGRFHGRRGSIASGFLSRDTNHSISRSNTGPRPTPRMASRADQFKAAKKEMQREFEKAEAEENRKIKETDEAKEPSPWLRRVGCIPHLAGVDGKEAREFVEPVDERAVFADRMQPYEGPKADFKIDQRFRVFKRF